MRRAMNIINVGNRIMNVYVYRAPIGLVMIDTGYENGLKRVEKKLASYNLSMAEIKYVFLTHAHDDHAGFLNELLKNHPDIRVFINPASLPVLKRGQNRFEGGCSSVLAFWFCKAMALAGKGQHRFPPIEMLDYTHYAGNQGTIGKDLGGRYSYPGHKRFDLSEVDISFAEMLLPTHGNPFPTSDLKRCHMPYRRSFEKA